MELDELPSGWRAARIREICEHPQYGHTASAQHAPVGPKMLRITDIQDGRVDWPSVPFCRCDDVEKYRLKVGDILFARTGATTGKSFLVREVQDSVFASYLIRLRVRSGILPEFLFCYFQSSEYWSAVGGGIDDGNRPNMNGSKLAELVVPFPEKEAEQWRIVARVETLTHRLDQARQARQAAIAEAAAVGQTVWDRAFADIPAERWVTIGTHAKVQGGYAFKSEWFIDKGIRLLRNQNVYHGDLDWSDTVHLPPSRRGEFKQFELAEGDIVITMDRPLIKSGLKAARVSKKDLPCLLLQRVGRFLCDDELDKDYLLHFMFSQSFTPQISGDGRSCAVPHISPKQIEAILIPLPLRREQRAIVARLDAVRVKLDKLQRLQREVEVELALFTPALLAKAFKGEL